MIMAQGIDDFNWGTVFGQTSENNNCQESGPIFSVSGSGTAQTQITAQEANADSSYLEFRAFAEENEAASFETFPYDFTVQPILHYLSVAIQPVKRVNAAGIIRATANLASGLPAPDGLPFNLAVTWPDGGVASYSAVSSGGVVGFQLALPETAYGKTATFEVSLLAERKEVSLIHKYKRLARHARQARGRQRGRLHRRARQAKHALRVAHSKADSACGIA